MTTPPPEAPAPAFPAASPANGTAAEVPPASQGLPGLRTVSLRRRVTVAVIAALGIVLALLGLVVDAVFAAQSERSLETLLTGRTQLARQLARSGVRPQALVNRVSADGVQASLRLRNGTVVGTPVPAGARVRTSQATLKGPGRINNTQLTLVVDTSLVADARTALRRALVSSGAAALALSALLVAGAVPIALRPLTTMANLARTIADGRRGSRLAPTRTDTELGRTAAAFDDMLDELEGAETRARNAEARTRAFLADAAHELRTPVAGMQAAAETLLQSGERLDPPARERLEVLAVQEASRAGRLVADLLAAARLDAGIELSLIPFSLTDLATEEAERAQLVHPEATVQASGPPVQVTADRDQMAAVLRNLSENALRAAGPRGQMQLTVRTEPGAAIVEVRDSGPGVPPADAERVFARLVRLDTGRGSGAGGSGLGLAIARGYARAHGGDLTCEPAPPGGGALFRLRIPLGPGWTEGPTA